MLQWIRAWKVAILAIVVLVGGAGAWFGPSLYRGLSRLTTGAIYISGPQVYTRERLVNDRYREDAWLLARLNTDEIFGITEALNRQRDYIAVLSASAGKDATGASNAPPTGSADKPADKPAGKPADRIPLSAFDQLHAALTYREQIRTLIIENQLDDRHDLRGNSLYRLRFDAAVLPGDNTHASAKVTVSVQPPAGLLYDGVGGTKTEETRLSDLGYLAQLTSDSKNKAVWERIYLRWLDSLDQRFEDGRKAVRTAYEADQFAPADYDLLLATMRAAILVDYNNIIGHEAAMELTSPSHGLPQDVNDTVQKLASDDSGQTMRSSLAGPDIVQFRKSYSHGDAGNNAPGHQAFKAEIERLIGIARQVRAVWKTIYSSSILSPAPPPPPPSPTPPLTTAAVKATTSDNGCGDLGTYGSYWVPPPGDLEIVPTLSYFLDKAFEGELAKSILGLQPEGSTSDATGTTLNSIAALEPVAVVRAQYGASSRAFTFRRQVAPLVVTDQKACIPVPLKDSIIEKTVAGHTVYVLRGDVGHIAFLIPGYDVDADIKTLVKDWPITGPTDRANVVTHIVDAGLINFIRAAGRRLDAFSYAFTPSEPDEIAATQSIDEQTRTLAGQLAGTTGSGGVKVTDHAASDVTGNETRKMVVPFGDQSSATVATFGWVIEPQDRIGGTDTFRQRASQTSLTALISLPAWWEEMRIRITRSWVSGNGEAEQTFGTPQDYTIELPVNFETIDASLFETNDRSPVINEWATEGVVVRPCVSADIVIPGRRLWRSTVVMLGSQKADEIYVLPDMNGIVAKFNQVLFPSTWPDPANKDYEVPLTVWTSQGSTSLPIHAKFLKQGAAATLGCPGAPGAGAGGTAQAGGP
jgi:hypothetical protein